MVDAVISSLNITTLGGPSRVVVQSDLGPAGQRGSLIFASLGSPNGLQSGVPSNVLLNDLAIDVLSSSDTYLGVFQYQGTPAGRTWIELTRLLPGTQTVTQTKTFTDGEASFSIPVNSIISANPSITPASFAVQYSIESDSLVIPSSVSIEPDFENDNGSLNLAFSIKAFSVSGDPYTISNLTGDFKVNLIISLIEAGG